MGQPQPSARSSVCCHRHPTIRDDRLTSRAIVFAIPVTIVSQRSYHATGPIGICVIAGVRWQHRVQVGFGRAQGTTFCSRRGGTPRPHRPSGVSHPRYVTWQWFCELSLRWRRAGPSSELIVCVCVCVCVCACVCVRVCVCVCVFVDCSEKGEKIHPQKTSEWQHWVVTMNDDYKCSA
jgi:hypothetical protein